MPQPRTWQTMWENVARRLEEETGTGVAAWNSRITEEAPEDEPGLRRWLTDRGVTGYAQSLLVMERLGYPDFLQMSDVELIDGQYRDRGHLRPVLDRLLALVTERHPDVEVVARKTYVALYTPRRQFAVVKATTRSRVDLGLRLDGQEPHGRLVVAKGLANETINLRIPLSDVGEVDDEVRRWIDEAWRRSDGDGGPGSS